jgi:rRNA maturation endonuclease Nob1
MGIFSKDQTVICPGCGSSVQSTDKFCKNCGRPAAQGGQVPTPGTKQGMRQCAACGRGFPEGLNFCPYCGKPAVESATAAPVPAAPSSASAPSPPAPAPRPMAKCVNCGREIQEGLKFCPYCARPDPYAPMIVPMPQSAPAAAPPAPPAPPASGMERCKACNKEIPSGLKYCPYCGRLAAEQPVPAPAPTPQPAPAPPAPIPPAVPASAAVPVAPPTTKKCNGCGREINAAMKFCPYCGTANAVPQQAAPAPPAGTRLCPGCAKEISITHDFCPSCGYPKNPKFY